MKKKDLIKLITNQDILRLINFDDLFYKVAETYYKEYIAWKRYDNCEYNEDFDVNFINREYDEIVKHYRHIKGVI